MDGCGGAIDCIAAPDFHLKLQTRFCRPKRVPKPPAHRARKDRVRIAELQALVDAGEYREMVDPILFRDLEDEPEYQRLVNIMAARPTEQRNRPARMEVDGERAVAPQPIPAASPGSKSGPALPEPDLHQLSVTNDP